MPFHRIPRARLHEDITALEREHEIVVSTNVDPDDTAFVLVFTRWCGQDVGPHETRLSTLRTVRDGRYGGAA